MNEVFAFDLDGTLYFGDQAVEGMVRVVNYLHDKGYQIVYHTNNSGKSIKKIKNKLSQMNYPVENNVYSSASLTTRYCIEEGIHDAHVIGSSDLIYMLKYEANIQISDTSKNLIVGLTEQFQYEDLSVGIDILMRKGKFIVCNIDSSFPIQNEQIKPGCGTIVAALSTASRREPDAIVGKPSTYLLECIREDYDIDSKDIIVVGDSFTSDVEMALAFECSFVWAYNLSTVIDHLYINY